MSAPLPKLMLRPLRVAVLAADADRRAALTRMVGELGHVVVRELNDAIVVLADGVLPSTPLPTVAIGRDTSVHHANELPHDASPEQIDAALRAVAVGLSVSVVEREPALGFRALDEGEEPILLTPRETQVLGAVADGSTNKEIARDFGISLHTVKFHLESVMRKLNASSRAEAVSKSMRLRLLEAHRL
jgi:DNA-binding NarL/FixJ family response regulator